MNPSSLANMTVAASKEEITHFTLVVHVSIKKNNKNNNRNAICVSIVKRKVGKNVVSRRLDCVNGRMIGM